MNYWESIRIHIHIHFYKCLIILHKFVNDPYEFIDNLNLDRVVEIHLAGGELNNGLLIDTHAHSISDNVWRMLEYTLDKGNIKGVVVERDRNFEDIDTIIQDINKAKKLVAKYIVTAN